MMDEIKSSDGLELKPQSESGIGIGEETNTSKKCRGHEMKMDRVTFRLGKKKKEMISTLVEEDEFDNMSDALRTAVDTLLIPEGND